MFREFENIRRAEDWIYTLIGTIKERLIHGQDGGHDEFGHGGDHHGTSGPQMPTDMFDPELANQEMLEAIPEFMAILPEKYEAYIAELGSDATNTPADLEGFGQFIRPDLEQLGVNEEEFELLGRFLEKNLEHIRSQEDFVQGLSSALMMIASGYPEMLDPTPADGLMMMLRDYRKELESRFADNFDNEAVVNDLKEHL